ncbi:hypothetical protein E0H72_00940 [Rhizobium leguminosarum bv. viciae]|jgi:hypothetical protein|nr:hypothetical protein E0H61_13950 [Rhizobium leguminosarum bv. viciae]TCA47164.1 hypothetical protein E0H72_00940 [Rhizobium leguminosarum bv. viciae]
MAQAAIMQHIIMPPQFIIIGMPLDIIRLQHSMNMSLSMPSIGFISQTMPSAVIVHFMEPIIIIIGMEAIIGIMAPFIMGMPDIIGIIPPIIGFIMAGIMLFIIGIMFMAGFIVSLRSISWRFVFR